MTFVGTLRDYQEDARYRMSDRGQMLIGMVMGAGKTPTTIAALEDLRRWGEVQRTLIVVPASLKFQWRNELRKFTDRCRITVIDGTREQRAKLWRLSISSNYVIVNAESLMNDYKRIGEFQCMVIDEATMIKTRTAKRSRLLKKLGKDVFYRFALTGQPIENRPEELFSIMEFVDPDVLGPFPLFDQTFIVRDKWGKMTRARNLDALNESLSECMVRCTFDDIKDQMPNVIRQEIPVPFSRNLAATYRKVSDDLLRQLRDAIGKHGKGFNVFAHYEGTDGNEAAGQVMTRITALKMLCDHPRLVLESAALYDDPSSSGGSVYASEIVGKGWLNGLSVKSSPKYDAVIDYVTEVLEESPDNKVVLFSFYKNNLRWLKEALAKYQPVLFMGGMTAPDREASKQEFASNPECRVFLSSDAGGYGVDLPMANYLISLDLPWSSGKLEQREARIIRLSSEFPHVTVASFVMEGSIEEWQADVLETKKLINEAFVDGRHHDAKAGFDMTVDSLTRFLEQSSV